MSRTKKKRAGKVPTATGTALAAVAHDEADTVVVTPGQRFSVVLPHVEGRTWREQSRLGPVELAARRTESHAGPDGRTVAVERCVFRAMKPGEGRVVLELVDRKGRSEPGMSIPVIVREPAVARSEVEPVHRSEREQTAPSRSSVRKKKRARPHVDGSSQGKSEPATRRGRDKGRDKRRDKGRIAPARSKRSATSSKKTSVGPDTAPARVPPRSESAGARARGPLAAARKNPPEPASPASGRTKVEAGVAATPPPKTSKTSKRSKTSKTSKRSKTSKTSKTSTTVRGGKAHRKKR